MPDVVFCIRNAVSDFLLSREASGATPATLRTYAADLVRFTHASGTADLGGPTPEGIEHYLVGLRARMTPISAHRHYRTLRTFFRWCVRIGRLSADPMANLTMRVPKLLPRVPADDAVRRLLAACDASFEGRRNRALIALAADSGLRKEELRCLRCGDVDQATRTLRVHQGKGRKDGLGFFGEAAASMLRAWLAVHPDPRPSCFVFVARDGAPLGPWAIVRILHRLSRRAALDRPIGPHALRHYAATAVWRRTGDLELVRRVLRHETLTMALRYVRVTETDLAAKFALASPLDHLGAARHGRDGPSQHTRKELIRR
jgi:integrase/recombinase XerC